MNVITDFFGGMAGCAMIGQTVINVKSGGRGRLSTLASGVFLLLMVVFANEWVAKIPMAALVAVMIMVSIGTFNWASFKNLREHSLDANIVMIATVAVTVFTLTEPKRVLIAFDGGSMTRRGVEMVAASPLFRGLSVHVLMSGKPRRDSEKQLDWARSTLEETGFEVSLALIHGDTERVIAQYVHEQSIDMLLMGAYGHSPLRSLFLGSKTTDLLRSAKVPTLLLR